MVTRFAMVVLVLLAAGSACAESVSPQSAAGKPQSSLGFWKCGPQNRGKERHLVDPRRQLSDELFQAVVQ